MQPRKARCMDSLGLEGLVVSEEMKLYKANTPSAYHIAATMSHRFITKSKSSYVFWLRSNSLGSERS